MIYLLILLGMVLVCVWSMTKSTKRNATAFRQKEVSISPKVSKKHEELTFAEKLAKARTQEMEQQYAKEYQHASAPAGFTPPVVPASVTAIAVQEEPDLYNVPDTDRTEEDENEDELLFEEIMVNLTPDD